jgi:hypothetical protein
MDMGRPAKVLELAETIISLSGLKPYDDIDIVFTGIRPGEKLYEEILTSREYEDPTLSDRLFVAKQERLEYDRIASTLQALHLAVQSEDVPEVVAHLRELVPSFQPGEHLIKKSAIAKNGEPETPSPTDASIALTPVSGNGAAAGGAEPDAGPIVPAAIVHSAAPTKAR